ncbi:hypothetical protein V6N13_148957 [Hibiscus sabdariffa]|uniref:Uncharacterized protein n=1 Tax=Hibiscus sabdariffa TaxID=183260 RepID=A0ABR2EIS6_9ROSI
MALNNQKQSIQGLPHAALQFCISRPSFDATSSISFQSSDKSSTSVLDANSENKNLQISFSSPQNPWERESNMGGTQSTSFVPTSRNKKLRENDGCSEMNLENDSFGPDQWSWIMNLIPWISLKLSK